jgi:hypothetical protein
MIQAPQTLMTYDFKGLWVNKSSVKTQCKIAVLNRTCKQTFEEKKLIGAIRKKLNREANGGGEVI